MSKSKLNPNAAIWDPLKQQCLYPQTQCNSLYAPNQQQYNQPNQSQTYHQIMQSQQFHQQRFLSNQGSVTLRTKPTQRTG